MISLYDAPSAQFACEGGADVLLVGDSMGNVVLGYDSTAVVTLDDIARATGAVSRGVKSSSRPDVPVVADLPIGTYSAPESAVNNAAILLRAGASAIKLEGAGPRTLECCAALQEAGIAFMGHLGYTPQSHFALRGVVQGKEASAAQHLLDAAQALQEAGAFGVVLEAVALQAAERITRELEVATIGIGSGPHCDGQVLVWHDLVGLSPAPALKFVKHYADLRAESLRAAGEFVREVQEGAFPGEEHGWRMSEEEAGRLVGEALPSETR